MIFACVEFMALMWRVTQAYELSVEMYDTWTAGSVGRYQTFVNKGMARIFLCIGHTFVAMV